MPTIFTRIIDGDLPGTFVWRDDRCVAFLSINPLRDGHTLVVPREEVDHWIDCPEDLRNHLFGVAQTIGRAIDAVWHPERVGLTLVGLDVPHLHIHVSPIWSTADLDFRNAGSPGREELDAAAEAIRGALRALGADGVAD
jgi:histidine triad (HIT) family protein